MRQTAACAVRGSAQTIDSLFCCMLGLSAVTLVQPKVGFGTQKGLLGGCQELLR